MVEAALSRKNQIVIPQEAYQLDRGAEEMTSALAIPKR